MAAPVSASVALVVGEHITQTCSIKWTIGMSNAPTPLLESQQVFCFHKELLLSAFNFPTAAVIGHSPRGLDPSAAFPTAHPAQFHGDDNLMGAALALFLSPRRLKLPAAQ